MYPCIPDITKIDHVIPQHHHGRLVASLIRKTEPDVVAEVVQIVGAAVSQ